MLCIHVGCSGGKGGGAQSRYTTADAGMRHGAQRQSEEAGGWKVRATSRWTVICSGRGGGYQVKERGSTTKNATDLESGGGGG